MGTTFSGNSDIPSLFCKKHNIPYLGICGEKNCLSGGFICNKCDANPCVALENHQLLSLHEFYLKFFADSIGTVDYKKLNLLVENLRKIDRDELTDRIQKYSVYANSLIDEKLVLLNKRMAAKLEEMKFKINLRLENLQKEYFEAESRIDLSSFEIPENFTIEETKKFFDKHFKSVSDIENMINLVKRYSDNEKLKSNQRDMETIIYTKSLADLNSKEILEEKLEIIIKELDEGLNEILTLLEFHKENSFIFNLGLKKFYTNPSDLKFKMEVTDKCQKSYTINSVFCAFTTFEGYAYVAWASQNFSVEVFDLRANVIAKSLTGHTQHVYIVRHFFNTKNKIDYLVSTSYERSCRVWNANNFSLVLNIPSCHTGYYLYSALLVFDQLDNKSYVVTCAPNEFSKVWELTTGKCLREIATNTDYTYFLEVWYDVTNNNIYIINANSLDLKIYEFYTGNLFKTFKSDSQTWHMSALVHEIENIPHLFETDGNGYLRIWNINTGKIFKSIQSKGHNLRGLCLWNDNYIIAASSDKSFKIFDLFSMTLTTSISGHDNVLCTVDKVKHPIYGEVLLSSAIDGKIKLWVPQNK
jgi:WD40 repeat protein